MKKFILFATALICLCSCGTYIENEYNVTISYTIDGDEKTSTRVITGPEWYTPAYSCNGHELYLFTTKRGRYTPYQLEAYSSSFEVRVTSFNYTRVRSYTASKWDGHEIKKK